MVKVKKGFIDRIRRFAAKNSYFTIHDAKRIVDKKYAYLALNILTKRKEIFRLGKGFYSKYDDPSLIVYYFKPAYIGLHDAMSYLNLWEQETATIVITVRKVRRGVRKVFKSNVLVKKISPKYFFGFDFLKINDFYLPVSDAEKTFIDLIYFKEWKKDYEKYFKGKIKFPVLRKYSKEYPKRIERKILKIGEKLKISKHPSF